jgi:hypothetical protein
MGEAADVLQRALVSAGATDPSRAVTKSEIRPLLAFADDRFKKAHPIGASPGLVTLLTDGAVKSGLVTAETDLRDAANPRFWARETENSRGGDTKTGPPIQRRLSTSRSQAFIDALRVQELGPFSRLRLQLYRALADAVRESASKKSDLYLRVAVNSAIASTRALLKSSVPETLNWRKVSRTYLKNAEAGFWRTRVSQSPGSCRRSIPSGSRRA